MVCQLDSRTMILDGAPVVFLPRPVGADLPWYRAGGCPNPIAVWQPKAADGWTPANIAASYVNRVNPGTYDAAPGTAPAWDPLVGWTFTAASLQYLTTGLVPANDQSYSMVVRYNTAAFVNTQMFAGATNGGGRQFSIGKWFSAFNRFIFYNGSFQYSTSAYAVAGTLGVTTAGYLNGVIDTAALGAWAGASAQGIYLGALNNSGVPGNYLTGVMTAAAVWNVSVSAYMAALHARLIAVGL